MKRKASRYSLNLSLRAQRRLFGTGIAAAAAVFTYWFLFAEGLPIIWGPTASAAEVAEGRELFEHEWTPNDPIAHGDGLGPVFNAKSCATCHFQGGLGGGGNNEHNAVGFEVHSRPGDPNFHSGTIHNFSIDPNQKESFKLVKSMFPTIPGRTFQSGPEGCRTTTTIPDFDPVTMQQVQTTSLFGAGWIDLISDKAIIKNFRNRGIKTVAKELSLDFNNVPVGRIRYVEGGVGKFGWKGQFARLEDFVAAACANELGLGTPHKEQAVALTGNKSDVQPDLDKKQFRSLVSFVKTLPKPVQIEAPEAEQGRAVFTAVGCAVCHVPNMGGVKGVYSDFLLYTLEEPQPHGGRSTDYTQAPIELNLPSRADDDPKPAEWKTPALWGVADSAPYLHDGSANTLKDAILRHRGDAKLVLKRFEESTPAEQTSLLAFLGTLKAPPDAPQLRDPGITRLVRK